MTKTLVVVQARTGSSRLPGKVLLPLAGKPLLLRMVERVLHAQSDFEVVVATTTDPQDDTVVDLCRGKVPCFRGHPTDLLDRHVMAAREAKADVVLKIPSDCPLIDPAVIDEVLTFYRHNVASFDYVSNLHAATYPDGNDVEVLPMPVLEEAHRLATKPHEREHTTPFVWDQPARYRVGNVRWKTGRDYSMSHRFTIDYPEDYAFISAVYDALHVEGRAFSLGDILALLEERPQLMTLNAAYAGVNWYRNHLGDLQTITPNETRRL